MNEFVFKKKKKKKKKKYPNIKIKELLSQVRKCYFTKFILLAVFLVFGFFRPDSGPWING